MMQFPAVYSGSNPGPFTYDYQGYEYYLNDSDGNAAYNWLYESWGPWDGAFTPLYTDNYIGIGDLTSSYNSCSAQDEYGPDDTGHWATFFTMNQCPNISQNENNPYYFENYWGELFGNQDVTTCVSDQAYCYSTSLFGSGAGWCEAVWDQTSTGSVIIWWEPGGSAEVNPPGDCLV